MAKKMLIDATHAEETRVVVVDGTQVEEFDFETANKRQLAGNIYLAKITRVEPSLQAAFVDYGGNRHGFLAFAEIHPDYYQIPAADRKALLEEERVAAAAADAEEDARAHRGERGRSRVRAESTGTAKALDAAIASEAIPGMEVTDSEAADDDGPLTLVSDADADAGAAVEKPEQTDEAGDGSANGDRDDDAQGDDSDDDDDTAGDVERQVETASERDDSIESVADEHVTEEMPAARKPRARRYKIQEVIKVRQIMLVQVVKEERGNKGAALTTYLSLAGRYCVLMPNTARGGGISRKITNTADRSKLKEIASELEVPQGAGIIIRTAGSQRTRTEIRRDYEYLMRLWEQIRELTFRSVAPAPIYEEGDLIKRSIRDLYSKEIDEVLVEGERGYQTARDFMAMIMPTHARQVKHYTDPVPLFARYQVETYLSGMFNPVVQLKSGGYIVIGTTEALVAIDVNSGRATKEGSIEDTAYKTNCEAADEIARQLRLRDLAGLIVIDFIDMDERKNNANVEKRFKDRLKSDRARIQVGRISGFGLLEMSRQRLHPGMLESTTQPCGHCHGTGLIRSEDSLALTILRAIEEEGTKKRSREVLVKAPVGVANYLINQKREHVALIELRSGMSVRIEADPSLISPDFAIEKFKTATRIVPEPVTSALSVNASLMAEIDESATDLTDEDEDDNDNDHGLVAGAAAADSEDASADSDDDDDSGDNGDQSRSRRRRRRRRRGGNGRSDDAAAAEGSDGDSDASQGDDAAGGSVSAEGDEAQLEQTPEVARAPEADVAADDARPGDGSADKAEGAPAKRSRSRSRRSGASRQEHAASEEGGLLSDDATPADVVPDAAGEAEPGDQVGAPDEPEEELTRETSASVAEEPAGESEGPQETSVPSPDEAEASASDDMRDGDAADIAADKAEAGNAAQSDDHPDDAEAEPATAGAADASPAKRRGWWSFGV